MESKSPCFPYEKSIIINALYDTIEHLGLLLDSSNSARGTLIVSGKENIGKMRIALGVGERANQTHVDFFPEDKNKSFVEMWSPIILDELEGRIEQVNQLKKAADCYVT